MKTHDKTSSMNTAAPLTAEDREHVRDYADGHGNRSKREQMAAFIGTSVEARDLFFECLLATG